MFSWKCRHEFDVVEKHQKWGAKLRAITISEIISQAGNEGDGSGGLFLSGQRLLISQFWLVHSQFSHNHSLYLKVASYKLVFLSIYLGIQVLMYFIFFLVVWTFLLLGLNIAQLWLFCFYLITLTFCNCNSISNLYKKFKFCNSFFYCNCKFVFSEDFS